MEWQPAQLTESPSGVILPASLLNILGVGQSLEIVADHELWPIARSFRCVGYRSGPASSIEYLYPRTIDDRWSGRGDRSVDPSVACPRQGRPGGKSELGRARWSLTTTQRELRESATENIPPAHRPSGRRAGKGEMVR